MWLVLKRDGSPNPAGAIVQVLKTDARAEEPIRTCFLPLLVFDSIQTDSLLGDKAGCGRSMRGRSYLALSVDLPHWPGLVNH